MRFEAMRWGTAKESAQYTWCVADKLMHEVYAVDTKQECVSLAEKYNREHNEIPVTFAEAQAKAKAREARAG